MASQVQELDVASRQEARPQPGTTFAATPSDDRSIHQILLGMGYSHRKTAGEMGHEITHIATGEVIGFHHAHTAILAAETHASLGTLAPLLAKIGSAAQ